MSEGKYTFRVARARPQDADRRTRSRRSSASGVAEVRTSRVRAKPKRRGLHQGTSRAWKKAVVQLAPGDRIELFEGAAVEG